MCCINGAARENRTLMILLSSADLADASFSIILVPEEGLEPSKLSPHDFESCMYTNFITLANFTYLSFDLLIIMK